LPSGQVENGEIRGYKLLLVLGVGVGLAVRFTGASGLDVRVRALKTSLGCKVEECLTLELEKGAD
jgi:hypothetical protein